MIILIIIIIIIIIYKVFVVVIVYLWLLLLLLGNLWECLANSSKKPVGDVMNTWTKQMGFPVLDVSMEVVRRHIFKGCQSV